MIDSAPTIPMILLATILVNNFVLAQFLGLCPFMGVSKKLETATGMSLATAFVLTLASSASWIVDTAVLIPLDITYLRIPAFILIIAVLVQLIEMYMHKHLPLLYNVLGIFLPLITTNCAVLGVAMIVATKDLSFIGATTYGLGAGLGFALVLVLFAAMRERLEVADVPEVFKGAPLSFITAGLMALAFMGFQGLVNI